jgi:hypothetical protein
MAIYPNIMKRAVLELVVRENGEKFIIPIQSASVPTMVDSDFEMRFTINVAARDLAAALPQQEPERTPTTEDVLLRAVNTSIWLPVMAWRDHLIETDAREDVIWGLTWLIDHRKFPEERPDTPHGLCYCWSINIVPTDSSRPYCLPGVVCNAEELYGSFPTIHQAFWEAAVAIAVHRKKLDDPATGPAVRYGEDDKDWKPEEEDDSWDSVNLG